MDYSLLRRVLDQLEAYQRQQSPGLRKNAAISTEADLAAFVSWMFEQLTPQQRLDAVARHARNPIETDESQIGTLTTFLYRYVRGYARLALGDTPLVTFDDFTYLATTFAQGPIGKTELIQRNIHEKPTGTEVIKRLLARGLLQEQASATDRRSKLLTVTEAGRELLLGLFARMSQVAEIAAGNLSAAERHQLVRLLLKLDAYHHPVFLAFRGNTFDELLQQFFPHVPPAAWPGPPSGLPPGAAAPDKPTYPPGAS